jgi:hypothetical protein
MTDKEMLSIFTRVGNKTAIKKNYILCFRVILKLMLNPIRKEFLIKNY